MADYILSCCSTADLSKEHFERRQIHYICFHYTLDGVEYPDDLGQSVSFDRFYQAMADGAQTSTSQSIWSTSPIFWKPGRTSCT